MEHCERYKSMDQQGTTAQWASRFQDLEEDQIQWVLDWTKCKTPVLYAMAYKFFPLLEQCAPKPVYYERKAPRDLEEAGDKIKRSKRQLMNECLELHDDTRRVLNRYSMEPVASKAQRFEEHLRDLLESLGEVVT
ncbi:hypothetical protein ACH5RR_013148 [Cinchona calisaya]|uniref:Uncharacterized protein n=1 Tax=Cinchona calisaya TaxID=153742 RepID=A0ABD2ZZ86_9GENT